MMILSIGWKNVWRNKNRSLVVIISVMFGIFGGLMSTGIMKGWIDQRIHSSIYNELSHVQIHNPEYMLNEDMDLTVKNFSKIVSVLDTMPGVVAYSPRVKIMVPAQSDWGATGFMLMGVDPEKEKQVSEIYKNIIEGDFLEGQHKIPSIVIGSKAAEDLKLKNFQITKEKLNSIDTTTYPSNVVSTLMAMKNKRYREEYKFRNALKEKLSAKDYKKFGDELVKYFSFYRLGTKISITLFDTAKKEIRPVFEVRGIYETNNSMFDEMNAFVVRDKLNEYTKLSRNQVHEIAIISTDNSSGAKLGDKLEKLFPENSVMSWKKLSPEIAMYTQFVGLMGMIFVGIILFALAFGIINTMLMSVLERVKELGMLMAIGMNKKRVFSMIMYESIMLTLTGAVVGLVFSGILIKITGITGINLSMYSEGFKAIGYASVVYPRVSVADYISIIILVIITGIVSAIWPARKALKLNPAEALRTE